MDAPMTPRDIQFKIRSGESLAEVIAESGLPADRVEAFAAPILAEREHITTTALASPVRRRGETASARRLQQTVAEALLDRGQDINFVTWDSWRRSDGRWILQGTWQFEDEEKCVRYLYDNKGRFSIADNDQARVLVGDLPLSQSADADSEPTLGLAAPTVQAQSNLSDETTVGVRYTRAASPTADDATNRSIDDRLRPEADDLVDQEIDEFDEDEDEDTVRSDLDLLYDMISTIDEDSVRIFRGLRAPLPSADHAESEPPEPGDSQPSLIDPTEDANQPSPTPHRKGRKRASVPSWDDIIFGGRS
ncbi:MAG: DUF3071 domain-containing protein [Propionibacteriaceae bacterium]|jgi:hypothetical protein|nr:DUF3071 domain-containing protein [Propionibacteriaceae bacterium]